MPGGDYSYKSSGTNSQVTFPRPALFMTSQKSRAETFVQGNHYCARDYGSSASNSNSYHYSNS